MRTTLRNSLIALIAAIAFAAPLFAQTEPDYSDWSAILAKYYDPVRGMDYRDLKAKDAARLQALRQRLGKVNVAALGPKQQLAYWLNVYNINVVATIVEHYPVDSIRDISTDPIIRLNVFKKARVPFGGGLLSLDEVEHQKIREAFKDPRIHFAANCGARSCPPIRTEAYVGERLDAQLDDQVRTFLNGPMGARLVRDGDDLTISVTKIMDWYGDDFERWAGGRVAFIRKYLLPKKQRIFAGVKDIDFEFDDYDWALNDWKR